jgi:hypothetical protein
MNDINNMYGSDPDATDDEPQSLFKKISLIARPVHKEVTIDGHVLKIIDPEYVTLLEQRLRTTERMITDMRTDMGRMDELLRQRARDITKLQSMISNKVDKG